MIQKWVNFECGLRRVQIFSTISHEQSGFMEFHPNHNPPAIHGVWLSFENLKKASGSIPIKPAITPVIVQATSQFHDLIIVAIQSVSKHLLHDAAPFNTGDHMFDGHTNAGNQAKFLCKINIIFEANFWNHIGQGIPQAFKRFKCTER
jgi:hypothetical protein